MDGEYMLRAELYTCISLVPSLQTNILSSDVLPVNNGPILKIFGLSALE